MVAIKNMFELVERLTFMLQIYFVSLILINVLVDGLPHNSSTSNLRISSGSRIKGRGSSAVTKFIPDSNIAKKCKRDPSECERIKNYPTDHVKRLVLGSEILRELLTTNTSEAEMTSASVASKIGEWNDEEPVGEGDVGSDDGDNGIGRKLLCEVEQSVIFPKAGEYEDGTLRFIVQLPEHNITQAIRIEKCLQKGQYTTCHRLKTYLPFAWSKCVQRYSYPRLLTLDRNTGKILREPIKVPSHCACMYRGL